MREPLVSLVPTWSRQFLPKSGSIFLVNVDFYLLIILSTFLIFNKKNIFKEDQESKRTRMTETDRNEKRDTDYENWKIKILNGTKTKES